MDDLLAPLRGDDPRVDKAIDLIQFQWVEDPALDGASPAELAEYVLLLLRLFNKYKHPILPV